MTSDDKLRLDYEETNRHYRMLADIRFKLLAFVPTASGAALALISASAAPELSLAMGLLGLFVMLGIMIYEIRNTQFYDAAVHRAKWLEVLLELPVCARGKQAGGLFNERPQRPTLFWKVKLWHDLGLALVYGAALGGWIYLTIDSISILADMRTPSVSVLLSMGLAFLAMRAFLRLGGRNKPQPTEELRKLVEEAVPRLNPGPPGASGL
jgi:hypothetical protein